MRILKALLLVVIAFLLTGCEREDSKEVGKNYAVAAVETSSSKQETTIHYFDEDLEPLVEIETTYANVGSYFYQPQYEGDEVYLLPRGVIGKGGSKQIISINRDSLDVSDYKVDRTNIQNVYYDTQADSIYTSSNLDFVSYLTKTSLEGAILNELEFPNQYLTLTIVYENNVYAFLTSLEEGNEESLLNIYDINLEMKESIDISNIGKSQSKYLIHDNIIYVSTAYTTDDNYTSKLLKVDTTNFDVSYIDLIEPYPSDLNLLDNNIVISSFNEVAVVGSKVILLDIETGKQKSIDLDVRIDCATLYNGSLYILSETKLHKFSYDKNAQTFTCEKSTDLLENESHYYSVLFHK